MKRLLTSLGIFALCAFAWTAGPGACSCVQEMEHGGVDAAVANDAGNNGGSDGGAHNNPDAATGDGGMGDGGLDDGGMGDGGMDDGGMPDAG